MLKFCQQTLLNCASLCWAYYYYTALKLDAVLKQYKNSNPPSHFQRKGLQTNSLENFTMTNCIGLCCIAIIFLSAGMQFGDFTLYYQTLNIFITTQHFQLLPPN